MAQFRTHSLRKRLASCALALMLGITGVSLTSSTTAYADPPSQDDVNRAKQQEADAKKSVNQIESELANLNKQVDDANDAMMMASGAYEEALANQEQAESAAEKAQEDASKAEKEVAAARKNLGQVATSVFRSGSGSLSSLTPYIKADGLETIAARRVAIELFGAEADTKMQTFSAAKEVADVLQKRAEVAAEAAEKATQESAVKKAAAEAALAELKTKHTQVNSRRDVLVAELARRHGITVELQRQRQEYLEQLERERQRKLAEERAKQQAAAARRQAAAQRQGSSAPARRYSGSVASRVIAYAKTMLGLRYVWGGTNPRTGVDCSGMVQLSFRSVGIYLPRTANQQFYYGRPVSFSNMKPGDLLGWSYPNGHVYHIAIYIGNGMMIESPAPGMHVRITSVRWRNLRPYASRVL